MRALKKKGDSIGAKSRFSLTASGVPMASQSLISHTDADIAMRFDGIQHGEDARRN